VKEQANGGIRAHLVRGALWLLLLPAVGVIPFVLAQRVIIERSVPAMGHSQLRPLPKGGCGPAWRIVTSPNSSPNTNILFGVVGTSTSDGWTVGTYYDQNFTAQTLIEHWDGSAWTTSSSPNPGSTGNQLNAVAALAPGDAWAVGFSTDANSIASTLVEHWNGASWNVVPSPNNGGNGSYLQSIAALATNNVWAVGYYIDANLVNETLVEHWDGTSWNLVNSPNRGIDGSQLYGIAAVSAGDIWAVGNSGQGNGVLTLTEHWDGTAWSIINSPNPGTSGNYLQGVAVVSGVPDIWSVGYYYVSGHPRTLIERWDGSNWNIVPSPNVGTIGDSLFSVSGSAANDVWTIGAYNLNNQTGTLQTLIEQWDGSNWTVVLSPNQGTADNILYALTAISTGDAWSVGTYSDGINGRTLTLHYNDPCATPTPTPTPTATPCASVGSWTEQAPYPIAVSGNAVGSQGGNVYSFGGIANNTAIANAYKYTPGTNTWTAIASLPAPRGWFSAASDGTYIYLLGGVDQNFTTTATLWRYDPASNTYNTSLPSYTIPTYFHASAYLNGKIYRIAGRAIGTDFHVEVYNIATNTWSMAANYPVANHSLMAAALGGYIYGAGGNAFPDKTYRYDPNTNTWDDAAIADLPAGRSAAASGVYNGRWLLGGGDVNFAISNSAIAWDPATNTWSNLANMVQARDYLAGATAGQSFYAVAGNSGPGTPTNDNQQYTETGCATPTPTPTATPTATATATATPTPTSTATATATATPTPSATATATATPTPTTTPTPSATPRATPTPRARPTPVPRPTP
jgi:hypothetical protein